MSERGMPGVINSSGEGEPFPWKRRSLTPTVVLRTVTELHERMLTPRVAVY